MRIGLLGRRLLLLAVLSLVLVAEGGAEGVIELDPAFYIWTGFRRRHASDQGNAAELFARETDGRGMQFQAAEVERCIAAGLLESELMPLDETVAIMRAMDEIALQMRTVTR